MKRRRARHLSSVVVLLLVLGSAAVGASVQAQEGSPSGQPTQTTERDDTDIPWGLLGLLGLTGLAGLRRRPEPVRQAPAKGSVYDDRT